MGIGWSELILIFGLVLLLFGSKRIPELARALGKAKVEFQKAQRELLGGGTSKGNSPVPSAGNGIPEQQGSSLNGSSPDQPPSQER